MIRTVLAATLVLLPGVLLAAGKNTNGPDKKAQIKALEEQKKQLKMQLPAHLKQIDEAVKQQIEHLQHKESEMKKVLNAKLVYEDKEQQQRINARYDNIMRYLKPGAKQEQMVEEAHQTLKGIQQVLEGDNPDYGGHRAAAIRSIGAAKHQVKKVLEFNTHEERVRATKHMGTAVADLGQSLQYSWLKYGYFGYGNGVPSGMPKTQQASDAQLAKAIPTIEAAHWMLANSGPDREQFDAMRNNVRQKKDAEKQKAHAEYLAKIKNVDQEIAGQIHQAKQTFHVQADQKKQLIKAQIAAKIKGIDHMIDQLKKSK